MNYRGFEALNIEIPEQPKTPAELIEEWRAIQRAEKRPDVSWEEAVARIREVRDGPYED